MLLPPYWSSTRWFKLVGWKLLKQFATKVLLAKKVSQNLFKQFTEKVLPLSTPVFQFIISVMSHNHKEPSYIVSNMHVYCNYRRFKLLWVLQKEQLHHQGQHQHMQHWWCSQNKDCSLQYSPQNMHMFLLYFVFGVVIASMPRGPFTDMV